MPKHKRIPIKMRSQDGRNSNKQSVSQSVNQSISSMPSSSLTTFSHVQHFLFFSTEIKWKLIARKKAGNFVYTQIIGTVDFFRVIYSASSRNGP